MVDIAAAVDEIIYAVQNGTANIEDPVGSRL